MHPTVKDLPGDKGREHPHRSVREVEDAGGAIDEDDAKRGQREDGADAEADDRIGGKLRHSWRL
jgi:hypothetical protein